MKFTINGIKNLFRLSIFAALFGLIAALVNAELATKVILYSMASQVLFLIIIGKNREPKKKDKERD